MTNHDRDERRKGWDTTTGAALAKRHPEGVVEAAWDAVAEAAGRHADAEGRVHMENIALCAVGTR